MGFEYFYGPRARRSAGWQVSSDAYGVWAGCCAVAEIYAAGRWSPAHAG